MDCYKFASCSLTETEQRYGQIEKEMLAVQFGLNRFHSYIYGQPITVETDHKPLLGLKQKPLNDVTPRLQRMLLHCQWYDYELVYKPGRDLHLPDTLSRAHLEAHRQKNESDVNETIHNIYMNTIKTDATREELRKVTEADPAMQLIKTYILSGWPIKREVHPSVKAFYSCRDELSEHEGLLFKRGQVVIPV